MKFQPCHKLPFSRFFQVKFPGLAQVGVFGGDFSSWECSIPGKSWKFLQDSSSGVEEISFSLLEVLQISGKRNLEFLERGKLKPSNFQSFLGIFSPIWMGKNLKIP